MAATTFVPEWKKFEQDLHSTDTDTQVKAADAFDETRKEEMRKDPRARKWETDRKAAVLKDKPQWVKARHQAEKQPFLDAVKALKNGGTFETGMKPCPGFIVIAIEEADDKTASGIVLADVANEPNTAYVLATSSEVILNNNLTIKCPVQAGDHIMFKRGAGLDILLKGEQCRLVQFSDALGVLE